MSTPSGASAVSGRQTGIVLLAEGRSGSSWLGQLTDATGVMGQSSEWLEPKLLGVDPRRTDAEGYVAAVVAAASGANGRFALKVFPRHLLWFGETYGADFLTLCARTHELHIARLSRQDRLRQAISLVKARQTGRWSSELRGSDRLSVFDRAEIARAIHFVERSDAFWNAYETITGLVPRAFVYETLLEDPTPYLEWAAAALGVSYDAAPDSRYAIQRNAETEDWVARFRGDAVDAEVTALRVCSGRRSRVQTMIRALRGDPSFGRDLYRF
ncbi:hypothetical protein BV509_18630 [Rhodovulum sulfidophilum]|uniref:Sulphotransferase Stf0 domain-containing protein n=1 Tax=Rhodovulum visakhapatnamense TaxID=364297 RepID=A0ABS1RBI0_9RHOB|nr:Stf0 family sulfotransferase [Rhodovulum visakhapatnamense]MBL3569035.1 hypothetical protein [Rhodovulum visakhapatnamense]MBL3576997.1 hypothetical protein [Rhodovulum visakhapatnamense]OLS46164.1 hypothetical protein BV509_18630 [Rhodovulum sulfidophilum]